MGDTTNPENEKFAGAAGEGKPAAQEDLKGATGKPQTKGEAYAKGEDRSFDKEGDPQGKPGADDLEQGKGDYQGGEKFAQGQEASGKPGADKPDYGDVESGEAPRKGDAGYEKGEQP